MSSLDPTPVMSTSRNGSGSMFRPPGENDVIVGPGCSKHPGNVKFRNLIKAYKRARIQTNPKIDTIQAVKEVVAFWRNLSPRGRFLAQSKTDGQWQEVDESQTMRIASFFLMSSNERGELKRQKSVDAMRDVKKASAVTSMGRDPLSSSSHHGQLPVQPVQSQQRIKRPSGQQDMMGLGDFEPVPIGPVRSKSASAKSMGGAFDCGPDKTQSGMNMMGFGSGKPQNNNNFNRMSQDFHEPTKPKAQPKLDPDFGNFDFNPIPLGKDDDLFDPLPADFGMSSGSGNSKGQFGGSPSQQQQDQLQLSVNMVVPGSANFQLTTDTGNASIQISTSQGQIQGMGDQQQHQSQQKQQQSQKLMGMGMNPNGNGSSGSHNNAGIGGHQPQMNDLGFFGGGDNNSSSGGNGSMMGASGNGNGSSRNSANAMMMGNTNNGMAMNQMMGQNNGGNMMMNMNGQNTRGSFSNGGNNMTMGNTNNGMAMNQMMGQNNGGGNMMMGQNGQNTRGSFSNGGNNAMMNNMGGNMMMNSNNGNMGQNARGSFRRMNSGGGMMMGNNNANMMMMNNGANMMMMNNNGQNMMNSDNMMNNGMNMNPNNMMNNGMNMNPNSMMNNGMNMNPNNTMNNGMNMNPNMMNRNGNQGNGANGQRWNKNQVADVVPCAANLTGAIFDDF